MGEAEQVIERLRAAHQRGDWQTLASLLHPDGVFCTIPSGERPLGRDETVALFRTAVADIVYQYAGHRVHGFDERAGCAVASIRARREPHRGWIEVQRVTLMTVVDGLVYRMLSAPSVEDARELYERTGIELGLPAVPGSLPAA